MRSGILGKHTYYTIERFGRSGGMKPQWFGYPVNTNSTGEAHPPWGASEAEYERLMPISQKFSACGECWQKLGVHGVFNPVDALKALEACVRVAPGVPFRVVETTVEKKVIAGMKTDA